MGFSKRGRMNLEEFTPSIGCVLSIIFSVDPDPNEHLEILRDHQISIFLQLGSKLVKFSTQV